MTAQAAHPELFPLPAASGRLALPLAATGTLASGAMLAVAWSLHPVWWIAWLAPSPLLAAALADGSVTRARLLAAIAGLIAGVGAFAYFSRTMSLPAAILVTGLRAIYWVAVIGAAVSAARRLPPVLAVFALPLSAAGLETLILTLSPHATYGSYAHSQLAALPVIQVAALGGVPAIVFLVLTGASLLAFLGAALLGRRFGRLQLLTAAAAALAVVGGGLAFGALRLSRPVEGVQVPVAVIATGRFRLHAPDWASAWAVYGPAVEAQARPGVTVVLPEAITVVDRAGAGRVADQLSALAQRSGATISIGLEVRDAPHRSFNRLLLATPDGRRIWYAKQHLVPGLETPRLTPGHTPVTADVGGVRLGLAICKDLHFPGLGRRYANLGAQLMIAPAWDFVQDGWMSDRLSILRGVEGGFAMARSARDGISSLSDRYGRVLAQGVSRPDGLVVVRGSVPAGPVSPPPYARLGDAFGWTCVLAALALGIAGRRRASAG